MSNEWGARGYLLGSTDWVVETVGNKDDYRGRLCRPPWSSGLQRWESEVSLKAGTFGEMNESRWRKWVYRQLDFCLFQELRKAKRFDLFARVSHLIETKRYFRKLDRWVGR